MALQFTLNVHSRKLIYSEKSVQLTSTEHKILTVLIEQDGEKLPKSAILDKCWPGKVVTDNSVAVAISGIRRKARSISSNRAPIIFTEKCSRGATCYRLTQNISKCFLEEPELAPEEQQYSPDLRSTVKEWLNGHRLGRVTLFGFFVLLFALVTGSVGCAIATMNYYTYVNKVGTHSDFVSDLGEGVHFHFDDVEKIVEKHLVNSLGLQPFYTDIDRKFKSYIYVRKQESDYYITCVSNDIKTYQVDDLDDLLTKVFICM